MKYLLILLIFLASCSTQRKVERYLEKHPEICAEMYPAKDSVIKGKTDTVITTGLDTVPVFVDCPPVVDPRSGKTTIPRAKCPPNKTVYQTIHTTDTIIRVDGAVSKKLELTEKQLVEMTDKKNYWQKFTFFMVIALGLAVFFLFKK